MSSGFERNILVTGGAGFIGSNFLNELVPKYNNWRFINLDNLTYAASLEYLENISHLENYIFVQSDITDMLSIKNIFSRYEIDSVINFAAETHVDNSIENPHPFVKTNILGTFTLLESARIFWLSEPYCLKEKFTHARFYQISTDEVYGSSQISSVDDRILMFSENSAYLPNSPYSATKSAGDHLVRAYAKTYGLPVLSSYGSNTYGRNQHDEKFIPCIIRNLLSNRLIPIYGTGLCKRDWLYVEDHIKAIELIFTKACIGKKYNIGSGQIITNLELVNLIYQEMKRLNLIQAYNGTEYLQFIKDRPGHDHCYSLDCRVLRKDLSWQPLESLKTGLSKTLQWYVKKYKK